MHFFANPVTCMIYNSIASLVLCSIYSIVSQVTQDMKWKHLYNKLGLSSQITSASYSLKMAYKKHLFPFEEHQRTSNGNDTNGEPTAAEDGMSLDVKTHNQQSGDEECGSVTSSKSSSVDQESGQCNGPPPNDDNDNNTEELAGNDEMDTTEGVTNNRYGGFLCVVYLEGKF